MNFVLKAVLFSFATLILVSCSKGNDVILDASGKHPASWVVSLNGGNHPINYLTSPEKCQQCHGADLSGGVSKVSCFSSSLNGISCHAVGPQGHAAGWALPGAHGARAKAAAIGVNGIAFCKNCHGIDYRGAGVAQKDCFRCHTTAPHAPKPWSGTPNHATADTSNAPACAQCHTGRANLSAAGAANLPATAIIGATGCFNNTLCHGVMGHASDPQPWALPANHGARAKADPGAGGNTGFAACQSCHGPTFATVLAGNSCTSCHGVAAPHPQKANWTLAAGALSHVSAGQGNAAVCIACHNSTTKNLSEPYLTRFASSPAGSFNPALSGTPNCFNASLCHADVRKTSNCDACHSTASTNPFKSMAGVTAATDVKAGAHTKHLIATVQVPQLSANIACSECHSVPATPVISGVHRNGTNNVSFGTLATKGNSLTVTYTPATGACSNTYCHGATLTGGTNKNPVWNDTAYLAGGCGVCHGFPPLTTSGVHTGKVASDCHNCHTNVNVSGTGFVDPTLHINGILEVSFLPNHPGATPTTNPVYPGATHAPQAGSFSTACAGCHDVATSSITPAGSGFPVAAGSPPKCAGCHLTWSNGDCSDCHGAGGGVGRPNGTTFPNRVGDHNNANHSGRACTVCHPFTSGDTRHGWSSSRTKSTAAQVLIVTAPTLGVTSWNPVTHQCTASCHSPVNEVRTW